VVDYVIKGGYGLRNFGDDALMYFLVESIKGQDTDASISLDCKKVDYITKWLPDVCFSHPYHVPEKAYIYGGGTLYYSFPEKLKSKSFLEKVLLAITQPSLVLDKILVESRRRTFENSNVKKVMFGLGFGPFHILDDQYQNAIFDAKNADIVCVRDSKSYAFMAAQEVRAFHGTDICFASDILRADLKNKSTFIKCIGVIVRDWNYGTSEDNYKDRLIDALGKVRQKGFKVKFIVFSDLRDSDWLNTLSQLQEDPLIWNPDISDINSFMSELAQFDLLISSRFHGVIFSTLLSIPAISVAIEPKLELVKENAVCKVWHPINDSDEALLTMIDDFNNDYLNVVSECQELVAEKSQLYCEMFNFAFKE